jgi:hypothetical protein
MSEVILVNLVNFQEYILENIKQLKLFNYNITVIITDNLLSYFKSIKDINIILTNELDDMNYSINTRMDRGFRNGFWLLCSQRIFYLYSYMKKYNKLNCIHIENDVLLYDKIETFDSKNVWLVMDSEKRCIPGILLIPNYTYMTKLVESYQTNANDMDNLAKFYYKNMNICNTLPIINKNEIYNMDSIFNMNFNKYNKIFDGAAIGQYLGGVDPKNKGGDTRGFINETCIIDYSKYKFIWKYNDTLKLYQPYIIINGECIQIMNLHIHSKNLKNFISSNPVECKLIQLI